MAAAYRLFLPLDAVLLYRSLRRAEKEPIERFFDVLEKYPHTQGETTERDDLARAVQVKLIGRFKIVDWADHAVKEVKVLRL